MGISRHQIVDVQSSTIRENGEQLNEELFSFTQLVPKPHPQISSNLIISASTTIKLPISFCFYCFLCEDRGMKYLRMELACNVLPNNLAQPTLIGSVNILIYTMLNNEFIVLPFLKDLVQSLFNGSELLLCENASPNVGAGKGDRALDVLGIKGLVEVD